MVGQGFRSVSDGSRGLYGADGRTLAGQDGVNGQNSSPWITLEHGRHHFYLNPFVGAEYVDAESPGPCPYRVKAAATRTATKSASSAGIVEGSTIAITSSTVLLTRM